MEQLNSLEDLQAEVSTADGYMLGVTFLKNGNLTHHFFSDKFPFVDMLKSHAAVKSLILKQLESDQAA